MEEKINNQQKTVDKVYNYAAHLLMNDKKVPQKQKTHFLNKA
jgi:hypothetical protein